MPGGAARQGGFALLLVLWTMVLLSLIGTRIATTGRVEAQLAANIRDAAVTEAAADGAVQDAAFRLLAAPPRRWPVGGTEGSLALPGVAVAVRVESEEGRVNPNLASAELLAALMRAAGADTQAATAIAAAIVEWRFPGAAAGAAMRAYRAAGLAYGPPGKPFRSLDELGAVRGMTPALLAALTPYLSLFATGDPDAADAAPVVLAAMRAATGRAPRSERDGAPPSVVRVTAAATGPNGARFTRCAVLALNRRNAAPVRVLSWDAPGA
jgi:general secretion pathway protein K